jgi:DNA-binding NarL/FixJ family response regulator
MRVVVCDEDELLLSVVEELLDRLDFELVGVAGTTAGAIGLIQHARPQVVVIDPAIGYNSDFDMVDAAISVGAVPIVFTHGGIPMARYDPAPHLVEKPDILALEQALIRLRVDDQEEVVEIERRSRPARQLAGPAPTSLADAQAFYEALNDVAPGDALLSLDLPTSDASGAHPIAAILAPTLRSTDRMLATASAVRFVLAAGGDEGLRSLIGRIRDIAHLPPGTQLRSIIVGEAEDGNASFDRLRKSPAQDMSG